MAEYYPPVAFSFSLGFPGATAEDAAFSEVSGLESERDVTTVQEGGENRFVHQLPKSAAASTVVLKRGLILESSALFQWIKQTLESDLSARIEPKTVIINLLDAKGDLMISWTLQSAWPLKWSVAAFTATDNKVAIETLELTHSGADRHVVNTPDPIGGLPG